MDWFSSLQYYHPGLSLQHLSISSEQETKAMRKPYDFAHYFSDLIC